LELGAADTAENLLGRRVPTRMPVAALRMAGESLPAGDWLAQADLSTIVVGLGGHVGTRFAPVLARAARTSSRLTMAFVILPPLRAPADDVERGLDAVLSVVDS